MSILEIKELTVSIGQRRVIDGVSLDLRPGEVTALVGESGSGKTLTALAVLDLLPGSAVRQAGRVLFKGVDIFSLPGERVRQLRGNDIAMVFQEPFTALDPVMRCGAQVSEAVLAHRKMPRAGVRRRVSELFDMVKLPDGTAQSYPHELSGGMRQRLVLAMALACDPEVLMLDEPTTALDVSIQNEILELVMRINKEKGPATLFITHDFSVVDMIADRVSVMKNGVIVEDGEKGGVMTRPMHWYTRQLMECIPRLGDTRRRLPTGRT